MNSALRETWRPFVGKTNVGAERDNGGKIVAMVPNKEVSHVELIKSAVYIEYLAALKRK